MAKMRFVTEKLQESPTQPNAEDLQPDDDEEDEIYLALMEDRSNFLEGRSTATTASLSDESLLLLSLNSSSGPAAAPQSLHGDEHDEPLSVESLSLADDTTWGNVNYDYSLTNLSYYHEEADLAAASSEDTMSVLPEGEDEEASSSCHEHVATPIEEEFSPEKRVRFGNTRVYEHNVVQGSADFDISYPLQLDWASSSFIRVVPAASCGRCRRNGVRRLSSAQRWARLTCVGTIDTEFEHSSKKYSRNNNNRWESISTSTPSIVSHDSLPQRPCRRGSPPQRRSKQMNAAGRWKGSPPPHLVTKSAIKKHDDKSPTRPCRQLPRVVVMGTESGTHESLLMPQIV